MAATPLANVRIATLRNLVAAISNGATTNGTELVDAGLKDFKSGYFQVNVLSIDATSNDEVYTWTLEGRDSSSGAWSTLATIGPLIGSATPSLVTAVDGAYVVSVPRFKSRMRLTHVQSGTTPSVIYSGFAVSTEGHYYPQPAAVITA